MNRSVAAYLVILAGAFLWCALIVAVPFLAHAGGGASFWADVLREPFHRVCHQLDGRSLHLWGEPIAVCSRCSAIYFAFLAGTLLYPLFRDVRRPHAPSRALLILALMPMLLDVALGLVGIAEVTTSSRLVTGALFGLLIPFVVLPVALGAVSERHAQPTILLHQPKGSVDA
ncbi:MAG: DUF2085 domain-containing protein [Bacteroidetes bacterium]|nr:DUF2085 domain-containing protein [Bacteroidota bacterium]